MDVYRDVVLPLVVNLSSDRLAHAWDGYRARRTTWAKRLVPRLSVAAGGAFSDRVLLAWLRMPGTVVQLSSGRPASVDESVSALCGLIAGSRTVGPAEARKAAEAVVSTAYASVLEAADDPIAQLCVAALRAATHQEGAIEAVDRRVRALMDAQALQDDDLLRLVATVDRIQSIVGAQPPDVALDVLVADDVPWQVGALVEALRARGRRVSVVACVADVQAVLCTRAVDVLVVDLHLPTFSPSLLMDEETAHRTMNRLMKEPGGLEILRQLPLWSPSTTPIVWSAYLEQHLAEIERVRPRTATFDKYRDQRAVLGAIEMALVRSEGE